MLSSLLQIHRTEGEVCLKRPLYPAPKVQTRGLRTLSSLPESQEAAFRYHENIVLIKKVVGRVKWFLETPLSRPQAFLCSIKGTHMVMKG